MDNKNLKIVLWGHKIYSHTHSYIHVAFAKAFRYMGYEVHHFDDSDDVSHFDFRNSLFITEGQVDKKIPLRQDCYYVLHNCAGEKYADLTKNKRTIILQVYTDDVLKYRTEKLSSCVHVDYESSSLFMPWATDLLPHEIDANKPSQLYNKSSKVVTWVGTVGGGEFGNINEIAPFKKACEENGVQFNQSSLVSFEEGVNLIKRSFIAPTLVGSWQLRVGYIPCRIFKNISYGQFGFTNSPRVSDLFEGRLVQNTDTYQLYHNVMKRLDTAQLNELHEMMDFVKTNHTYVNRINTIIDAFEKINK